MAHAGRPRWQCRDCGRFEGMQLGSDCRRCNVRATNVRLSERDKRSWTHRLMKYARVGRLTRGSVHPPTDLDRQYLLDLFHLQRQRCWWTGIQLCIEERGKPWSISLDRLDHRKGYTVGNVVLTSRAANLGRHRRSSDEMISFVRKIREAP